METKNRICTMFYVYGVLALVLATIILCVIGNNECCIRNGMAIALAAISVLSIVGASFLGERQIKKDLQKEMDDLKKEKNDLLQKNEGLDKKLNALNQAKVQANAIQHEERMAIIKALSSNLNTESIESLERLLNKDTHITTR